jgi:hypothetical protein
MGLKFSPRKKSISRGPGNEATTRERAEWPHTHTHTHTHTQKGFLTANNALFYVVSFYVAIFGKETPAFNEDLLYSRQY